MVSINDLLNRVAEANRARAHCPLSTLGAEGAAGAEVVADERSHVAADGRGDPACPPKPDDSVIQAAPPGGGNMPAPVSYPPVLHRPTQSSGPVEQPARPGAVEMVKAIESQALSLGWQPTQLWNSEDRVDRLGLVAMLKPGEEIGEVTREFIELKRRQPDGQVSVLRLYNQPISRPWSMKIEKDNSHGVV